MPELGWASGHLVEGAPARHCDFFLCQTCSKFIWVKAKHFGCLVQTDLVQLNGWSFVVSLLRAALHEVLVQVAQMDEASKHPPHAADDGFIQADSVQTVDETLEVASILRFEALHRLSHTITAEQPITSGTVQTQGGERLVVQATEHFIETVVCPFSIRMDDDTRALQQVCRNACIDECPGIIKEHAVVLSEARGIGVTHRRRIAEGFQNGLCAENARLDVVCMLRGCSGGEGQVLHDDLGGLRLACAALSGDQHALVPLIPRQSPVGRVGDGIRVRVQSTDVLATVPCTLLLAVEAVDVLVGIHRQKNACRVRVDFVRRVPVAEILQESRIVHVH
mmetsp:Transcript_4573/g.11538  ORF Transcript_4573/g.11538 Transcript_4573/m.11538 type:complete len:336 (-) Transcript_4573:303-1310(-)